MTNNTNLAVQTVQQTPAAPPKAPASTKQPEKTFQQVMQESAQKAQQSQKPAQSTTDRATATVKTAEQPRDVVAEQTDTAKQGLSGVRMLAELDGVQLGESSTSVKQNFLSMLFGEKAVQGVDMEQSDEKILKDVYAKLTDPAAQFAMMLLMVFMQDNPEVSMTDVMSSMNDSAWSDPNVSPVQKVFTAITSMQQQIETLESSDTLDLLMQLARDAKTMARVTDGEKPQILKELEAQLMPEVTEKRVVHPQGEARAQAQDPAVALQQGQAQFKDAVTQARQMMQTTQANNTSAAQSDEAQVTGGTGQKRETGVAIDVEKLQAQVDANSYMQNTSHQIYQLRQAGAVVTNQPEIDPMELINQVRTGILSGVDQGENEFVLKLRPEGLGELTIHLLENGGKMTLSIVASNAQTQKLLTSELANLQAVMKPLHVEVQPVTTSEQASSSMEHSLSEQLAQQQFGEHNHGEQFDAPNRLIHHLDDDMSEQELQAAGQTASIGTSALDTYI